MAVGRWQPPINRPDHCRRCTEAEGVRGPDSSHVWRGPYEFRGFSCGGLRLGRATREVGAWARGVWPPIHAAAACRMRVWRNPCDTVSRKRAQRGRLPSLPPVVASSVSLATGQSGDFAGYCPGRRAVFRASGVGDNRFSFPTRRSTILPAVAPADASCVWLSQYETYRTPIDHNSIPNE
jgi:hypothetical protein